MTEAKGAARGSTEARLLAAARALIRKGWCQRNFAQDRRGKLTDLHGDKAVRFCVEGAVYRAGLGTGRAGEAIYFLRAANPKIHDLPTWNDNPKRTKREVLSALLAAERMASAASARNAPPESQISVAGSSGEKERA